jgi:hypothetical protein
LPLRQYDMVRIRRLLRSPDSYDGWRINRRPPRIGDVGAIVEISQAPGLPDHYVVENSGPDGITIWLGEFDGEELAAGATQLPKQSN